MSTTGLYWRVSACLTRPRTVFDRVLGAALATACLLLGVVGLILPVRFLFPPQRGLKDFVQEYVLGRALLAGDNPYLPVSTLAEKYLGSAVGQPHPSPHPPTAALFSLPLAALDYDTAAAIWFGLEVVWLAAAVYLLILLAGGRAPRMIWGVVFIAIMGWEPVIGDLALGQLMILLLLLLLLSRRALVGGRPCLAGALLGIALLVKPVPWPVLLALLLYRQWRALAASLATLLLGHGLAVLTMGLGTVATYYSRVLPAVNDGYAACATNTSLWSLAPRFLKGTGDPWCTWISAPAALNGPELARPTSVIIPLLVLALTGLAAIRLRDLDRSFGLMVLVSVVISPVMWTHYQILGLIPLAQLLALLVSRRLPVLPTTVLLTLSALLWMPYNTWVLLARLAAGQGDLLADRYLLPFLPSLLTMGRTALLVGLLALAARPRTSREALAQTGRDFKLIDGPERTDLHCGSEERSPDKSARRMGLTLVSVFRAALRRRRRRMVSHGD